MKSKKSITPKAVDELLAKELLQLSVEDRNGIQEEIHGVRCLAKEETPEFIYNALRQLDFELNNDESIPPSQKSAYIRSQELQMVQQHATYVNGTEFRLRILRCELFDVKKAARRMVNFLNYALEYFGEYALVRPIRISDFTKSELKVFKTKGWFQFLPFRDRSGRRIFIFFPGMLSRNDSPVRIVEKSGNDSESTEEGAEEITLWLRVGDQNIVCYFFLLNIKKMPTSVIAHF